jgi:hypothetical protein
MPAGDRAQERHRRDRSCDEDDELEHDAESHEGDDRGGNGRERNRSEEEHAGREDLADGQENCRDRPD